MLNTYCRWGTGYKIFSRSTSPNWITFLAWQLGQNQRPRQEKASRYSKWQSGQEPLRIPVSSHHTWDMHEQHQKLPTWKSHGCGWTFCHKKRRNRKSDRTAICTKGMQSVCGDDNGWIPVDRLRGCHWYGILQIFSSGFAIYCTSLTLHFSFHFKRFNQLTQYLSLFCANEACSFRVSWLQVKMATFLNWQQDLVEIFRDNPGMAT